MKNLNSFINEFKDGFQHNNRFAAKVYPPTTMIGNMTEAERVAWNWITRGFVCDTTNLPDRAFAETQITFYGLTEQIPFHSEFTTLDCTFNTPLHGADNPVPRVFHKWQNMIQDMTDGYDSTRDFNFPNNWYGHIEMAVLNRQNIPTLSYLFEKVYPKVIQSTPVTWKEENELTQLAVQFTFASVRVIPRDEQRDDFFAENGPLPSRNPFDSSPFFPSQGPYIPPKGNPASFPTILRNPIGFPSGGGFSIELGTPIGNIFIRI